MQTITLSDFPEISRLIKHTCNIQSTTYKKRKAFVQSRTKVELSNTYWDGGSRSTYAIVNLTTGQVSPCAQYAPPQFGGNAPTIELDNDTAVIETGIFCGKPATASVFVSPENYNKLLKLV